MRTTRVLLARSAVLLVLAAGCGGSGSGSPSSTDAGPGPTRPVSTEPVAAEAGAVNTEPVATVPNAAVDPNAPEVVEPGDIPDDQVFVTFAFPGEMFSVDVPEGWARTEHNGIVTFTDQYNSVAIQSFPATSAPTVQSVTDGGLTDVSSDPTFRRLDVTTVTRNAGDGVLATFEIGSHPNDVTGRSAVLSVERYGFFHDGIEVVLTLSGAKGADNVDPWRIVSDSVTWT